MNRIATFEKVSFEEFRKDLKSCLEEAYDVKITNEVEFQKTAEEAYSFVKLPTRATSGSAGYDIVSPMGFELRPQKSIRVPTGIRVKVDEGWFLAVFPKSGLGFKYRVQLDNTIGVVDEDYYYSDNEGHIFVKITNDNYQNKTLVINPGDKLVQGIFLPYGITTDDNATGKRNGGFGSTGR